MFSKLLLCISGLILVAYGMACAMNPALPASLIGLELGEAGARVEFVAMYGGLQTAMGLFFLHAGLRPRRQQLGLQCLALFLGSLGAARLAGMFVYGPDSYNVGAVCFELIAAALALFAMKTDSKARA
jgi:hypothetical protein